MMEAPHAATTLHTLRIALDADLGGYSPLAISLVPNHARDVGCRHLSSLGRLLDTDKNTDHMGNASGGAYDTCLCQYS